MRSQSSTEYLIVVAVVIIIGLIVVGVLGGIPGAGTSADDNAVKARVSSLPVGISSWSVNSSETVMEVINNKPHAVRLQAIELNGTNCSISNVPLTLKVGQKVVLRCTNVNSSDADARFDYSLVINWTNVETDSTFSEDSGDLKLVGEVATSVASSGGGSGGSSFTHWTNISGPTADEDRARGIVIDSDDNIIVAGICEGCGGTGGNAMRIMKFTNNGTHLWTNVTDPTASSDGFIDVDVDNENNIYAVGHCTACEGGTNNVIYVAKYNENGTQLWYNTTDTPGHDYANGVKVDPINKIIYVVGYCTSSCAGSDYQIMKYNENGTRTLYATHNPSGSTFEAAQSIDYDDSGNMYVTGDCTGCDGSDSFYTIKFDENGSTLWSNSSDLSLNTDTGWDIIVDDASAYVYVVGECDCPGALNAAWYIVKYDIDGNFVWNVTKNFGASNDIAHGIDIDSSNNIYVSGQCFGCNGSTGGAHYTIMFDENGTEIWENVTDITADTEAGFDYVEAVHDLIYTSDGILFLTGGCSNGCSGSGDHAWYTYTLNATTGDQS